MDSKDIQRIITAEEVLQLSCVVAANTATHSKNDSSPSGNISRPRCNGDETSDYTTAEADSRPFALKAVINQAPSNATDASCQVGDYGSHDGAEVRRESRSGIEAKPANPEKDGSNDDVGDVVRAIVELLSTVATSLSKHIRISQRGASGSNMHRSSTGKIETTLIKNPALRIPGPAGDRVVDDGGPNEHVDDTWQHTASLGYGAHSQSNGNASEHALVNTKHEIRNAAAPNGWRSKHIFEAEVIQSTNKFSGLVRKGQRIAPEEPLEGDHCGGHNRQPKQRKSRLPPRQARVEKATTDVNTEIGRFDCSVRLTLHRES